MYSDIHEQIFPGWQKMKHLTRTLPHLFCSLTFHRLLFTPRMKIAVVMFFLKQRLLPFTPRIMIWKKNETPFHLKYNRIVEFAIYGIVCLHPMIWGIFFLTFFLPSMNCMHRALVFSNGAINC